jgi:hypothetical protein
MAEGSITQALEIGILQLSAGVDLEEVLRLFPEFAAELRAPLEAAQAARWLASSAAVPEAMQQESRERFVLALGTTRAALQDGRRKQRSSLASPAGRRINQQSSQRRVLGILGTLVFLVVGMALAAAIASRALPGEPLYPLKLAGGRLQFWFQRDAASRLKLEADSDLQRNREVQALSERIRTGEALAPLPARWTGVLTETHPGLWKVQELNVIVHPGTQLVGQIDPGVVVVVDGLLQADGALSADRISVRQFQVSGRLERASPEIWTLDGMPFQVTAETILEGEALPGSRAFLILVKTNTGDFEARLIQAGQTPEGGQK